MTKQFLGLYTIEYDLLTRFQQTPGKVSKLLTKLSPVAILELTTTAILHINKQNT
jgi:hypothetical protein